MVDRAKMAAADKDGWDGNTAAEGFFDKVLAFEGDESGVGFFGLSESGAQFFYAGILPALYNANMRAI